MISTTETFIPKNQNKDYMLVDFVEMKKTHSAVMPDIMVVRYKEKDYELLWNEQYSYFDGKVDNEWGFIPQKGTPMKEQLKLVKEALAENKWPLIIGLLAGFILANLAS